jgi:hypothetical protein
MSELTLMRLPLIRDPHHSGTATDANGGRWMTYAVTTGDEQVLLTCGRCDRQAPWVWRHTSGAQRCGECVQVVSNEERQVL